MSKLFELKVLGSHPQVNVVAVVDLFGLILARVNATTPDYQGTEDAVDLAGFLVKAANKYVETEEGKKYWQELRDTLSRIEYVPPDPEEARERENRHD